VSDRLKQLFQRAAKRATYIDYEPALMGKPTGSGYTFEVPGWPGWVYVRVIRGSGVTVTKALNPRGVSQRGDLAVWVDQNHVGQTVIVGLRASDAGSGMGGGAYPCMWSMRHEQATVISGGALTIDANANMTLGQYRVYQNPVAATDAFEQYGVLAAGAYNLHVYAMKHAYSGILRWKLNGATLGTLDLYAATNTYNVQATIGSFTFAGGAFTLRGEIAGKNPGSSTYAAIVPLYWLAPA